MLETLATWLILTLGALQFTSDGTCTLPVRGIPFLGVTLILGPYVGIGLTIATLVSITSNLFLVIFIFDTDRFTIPELVIGSVLGGVSLVNLGGVVPFVVVNLLYCLNKWIMESGRLELHNVTYVLILPLTYLALTIG